MQRIFFLWLALFFALPAHAEDAACSARGAFEWRVAGADKNTVARKPQGKLLLVPGLNLKPEALDPLIESLNGGGYHVLLLRLSGHRVEDGPALRASPCEWRADTDRALTELWGKFPRLRAAAIGYSLGGALLVDAGTRGEVPLPGQLVLLAPALKLTFRSNTLRVLTPLKYFDLTLPSLAPDEYRLLPRTSLQAYLALRDLVDPFSPLSAREIGRLKKSAALILLNPDDELVSYQGTSVWLRHHRLGGRHLHSWKLEAVEPDPVREETFSHLIIDPRSLGSRAYKQLVSRILNFLD